MLAGTRHQSARPLGVAKLINIARKRDIVVKLPIDDQPRLIAFEVFQRDTSQLAHRAVSTIGPDEIAGGYGFRLAGFGVAQAYCDMRLGLLKRGDRPAQFKAKRVETREIIAQMAFDQRLAKENISRPTSRLRQSPQLKAH